ncbi:exonuclease 1 [Protopterus annectens]|uniref:exonuclease 1 n=1 Tax=Protopterus annectens TaxID=7888 RepID=UPI001CFB1D31|nr:exonuclease 1 [Protopterus annectens]
MGIQGLLQFIKDAAEPVNVKKYKGQTVAVDTYCWLHKGAFACADKLAKGEPTDQYVAYCMKFVDMLLSYGVKPVLVFDGCTLPSKNEVEKSRREKRQANLQKGKQLLREGKVAEARECFTRCVNITPAMAHEVIKAARAQSVDCIVAPYEADAQLAYLNKTGIAQAVITEDSDLLAFGCKKVILKMDKFGNGLEIEQAHLGRCKQLGDVFTEEKFRYMCILSGCDYLASVHGIGLAKACKLLRVANNPDIIKVIKKMGQYLKMNLSVSDEYIEGFVRANNTFLYQLVFDPLDRKLVPLNPYENGIDPKSLNYAGCRMGDDVAFRLALGNVDVNTMKTIDDFHPDFAQPVQQRSHGWNDRTIDDRKVSHLQSIWDKSYKPAGDSVCSTEHLQVSEKPCLRGVERVISTSKLKLPSKVSVAKRPRDDECSEDDLLNQYSFISKKRKTELNESLVTKEPCPEIILSPSIVNLPSDNVVKPPLKPRNKFATILQRKNEDAGAVVVPGTRSRFFCSPEHSPDPVSHKESHEPTEEPRLNKCVNLDNSTPIADLLTLIDEHEEQHPLSPDLNKSCTPVSESTPQSNRGTGCFSWSGCLVEKSKTPSPSGLLLLQQFHRRKDSLSWNKKDKETTKFGTEVEEKQESEDENDLSSGTECLSQSQNGSGFSQGILCTEKDSFEFSQESNKDSELEVSEHSSQSDQESVSHSACTPVLNAQKGTPIRSKVLRLQRVSPGTPKQNTTFKLSGPAKASGLRKRSSSSQKKKTTFNDENKPSGQVKINDLWKNFGFKRDSEKLQSCKKSEPMSPVKDNIQALTPETKEDIFSMAEGSTVQRAIFC